MVGWAGRKRRARRANGAVLGRTGRARPVQARRGGGPIGRRRVPPPAPTGARCAEGREERRCPGEPRGEGSARESKRPASASLEHGEPEGAKRLISALIRTGTATPSIGDVATGSGSAVRRSIADERRRPWSKKREPKRPGMAQGAAVGEPERLISAPIGGGSEAGSRPVWSTSRARRWKRREIAGRVQERAAAGRAGRPGRAVASREGAMGAGRVEEAAVALAGAGSRRTFGSRTSCGGRGANTATGRRYRTRSVGRARGGGRSLPSPGLDVFRFSSAVA